MPPSLYPCVYSVLLRQGGNINHLISVIMTIRDFNRNLWLALNESFLSTVQLCVL